MTATKVPSTLATPRTERRLSITAAKPAISSTHNQEGPVAMKRIPARAPRIFPVS